MLKLLINSNAIFGMLHFVTCLTLVGIGVRIIPEELGNTINTPLHGTIVPKLLESWFIIFYYHVPHVDVVRSHVAMMLWGMMFREIVGFVVQSLFPIDMKVLACLLISKPVPTHIP